MSLVLQDVSRRFGAVAAVDAASLSVGDGEIVALFGPSGCGKTTLLRCAAGLERPDAGTVELDGALLSGPRAFIPPEKRSIGFVFQDYVLFPHLSVLENVAFGLDHLPTDERKSRARAELAVCGLEELCERRPHQLSGGQQQRAALARALVRRPKAMLLDEPFAAIDSALRARLRDEVRRLLKASGAATILVTHDAEESLALGDRIALMKQGRVIETARPAELFAAPRTAEGALMFAGSQEVAAVVRAGRLETPFGGFGAAIPDGPARMVLLPGAVGFRAGPGQFTVADRRFAGPGWRIDAAAGDIRLTGAAADPCEPGSTVAAVIDPALIRIFPA